MRMRYRNRKASWLGERRHDGSAKKTHLHVGAVQRVLGAVEVEAIADDKDGAVRVHKGCRVVACTGCVERMPGTRNKRMSERVDNNITAHHLLESTPLAQPYAHEG